MQCRHVIYRNGVPCRCRKCINCLVTYRKGWALRIMHEARYYPVNSFITFTYNDDHLPPTGSLVKEHMQKFFRDLRYDFKCSPLSGTIDGSLRYFVAGEYGDLMRPHYHAAVFGLSPHDRMSREMVMDNWPRCDWLSLPLDKAFGTLTISSAEYVAGYIHKKYFGSLQRRMYQDNGLVPPYSAKSIGIGKRYAIEHATQICERGYVLKDGKKLPVPKYYYDILIRKPRKDGCLEDEKLNIFYENLLERNQESALDFKSSRNLAELLEAEQITFERRGKGLHRN